MGTHQDGDPVLQSHPLRLYKVTGDYKANWSEFIPPEVECGVLLMAQNTRDNSTRLYLCAVNTWKYLELEE